MGGTITGGLQAAATSKARYGSDWYRKIGAKGGKASTTGGFYGDREMARAAGAKGGRTSRRGRSRKNEAMVAELRQRISDGELMSELAREYGVHSSYVYAVHSGQLYRDSWNEGCICRLCERKRSVAV
jgi:general stress protein YciG